MKKFLLTAALLLFTLPVLAENSILIVGDSLSAGYGFDLNSGWVKLLEARLQEKNYAYRVINASISGDTVSNGLARLPAALNQYRPTITIIELGGNDGLRGIQLATIRENLEQMIELAKNADSKVLVLGVRLPPNYGAAYTDQFQQIFSDLATRNDISVVPLFLKTIDEDAKLRQPDGIHPTSAAQSIMLENVWPVLEPLLSR